MRSETYKFTSFDEMVARSEFPAILFETPLRKVTLQINTFTRLLEDIDCLVTDDM